jgi:hypothetical protein
MLGRSCATNQIRFLESVKEVKDGGKSVDLIYLDFSKAFDKVPHKKLLAKLRTKEICEEISRWIKHWLSDRTQRVWVGELFIYNLFTKGTDKIHCRYEAPREEPRETHGYLALGCDGYMVALSVNSYIVRKCKREPNPALGEGRMEERGWRAKAFFTFV